MTSELPQIFKPNQSFYSDKNDRDIEHGPNAADTMTNGWPSPVSSPMTNEPNQRFESKNNEGVIKCNPNAANFMTYSGHPNQSQSILRNQSATQSPMNPSATPPQPSLQTSPTNEPVRNLRLSIPTPHSNRIADNIMDNGRSIFQSWQSAILAICNPGNVAPMTNKPNQSFNSDTNHKKGYNSDTTDLNQSYNSDTNKGIIKYHPKAANIMANGHLNRSILQSQPQLQLQSNPGNVAPMTNKPNQSFNSVTNKGSIDYGAKAANIMANGSPYPDDITTDLNQSYDSRNNKVINHKPNAANKFNGQG